MVVSDRISGHSSCLYDASLLKGSLKVKTSGLGVGQC